MKVTYYYRDARAGNFSIEHLFSTISESLSNNITVQNFRIRNAGWIGRISSIRSVRKYQGDINHITGDINFIAPFLNGKKTVLTVHDLGYFENLIKDNSIIKKIIYKKIWLDIPFHHVTAITTVSQYTKDKILQYFKIDPAKITVIYNPYNPLFKFSQKKYNSLEPEILLIGTGIHKNYENLIKAIENIRCKLVIIGKSNSHLLDLLTKYKINFQWDQNLNTEELIERYRKCDIVFFASLHEGFGMPIIEANAIGRPVITSTICAMPEIARDAAHLVNPNNSWEIRKAIELISADELYRKTLINNGIKNIKRFELKNIANQYLQIYNNLYDIN